MFKDLNHNTIKSALRKDANDLLLQANIAELRKLATIMQFF